MSILIKGMEMPKDIKPGLAIEFADGVDGKRYARLYHYQHGGLTEWREAISVPPHGRLIDADALEDNNITYYAIPVLKNVTDAAIREAELVIRLKDLDAAPTIIPADEGE